MILILEQQVAQSELGIVDAVPIEVDDVHGRGGFVVQAVAQRLECRRIEKLCRHPVAQCIERIQQRQRNLAGGNETCPIGARNDHQDTHRQLEGTLGRSGDFFAQPPPHADPAREQVPAGIRQKLPGQPQHARIGGVDGDQLVLIDGVAELLPQPRRGGLFYDAV